MNPDFMYDWINEKSGRSIKNKKVLFKCGLRYLSHERSWKSPLTIVK